MAPGTAAQNTVSATSRSLRVVYRADTVIVGVVPVVAPFPHIAGHIVNPQLVRRFGAHPVGMVAAVAIIPRHIVNVVAAGILTPSRPPPGGNGTNINKIILSLLKYFNIPKIKNGKQQIIGR